MSDANYRTETFRQIQQQFRYEYMEALDEDPPVHFSQTSVYDSSLHEHFSLALHRLLPTSLPFLEDLLNMFCTHSHASKAYLFDVQTRLFVATDHSPIDHTQLAWCIDYLRLLSSFSNLYT